MTQASTANNTSEKKVRGTRLGTVVSDKRDKTRTVSVQYQFQHPKYGKFIKRQAKFHVHDADNASHDGDRVEIAPCRPISKTVRWQLVRIIEKAPDKTEHVSEVQA
jgi:small subunit ribosomal protein S17